MSRKKTHPQQIEFCDIKRDQHRPAGGGQVVDGFFVFNAMAQRLDQVAYTLGSSSRLILKQIQEGDFPNAVNIGSDSGKRGCYRIPRQDVLDYLESRKEGAR